MHLHCVHLAIIYSVSAKPLVLVCLGEDRKLFLPLRYSTAQVMLTTLLEYRSHSSSPCSTCKNAQSLSRICDLERLCAKNNFIFSKLYFLTLYHICTRPRV